ncbi:hypothetical protein BRD00_03225 [Halobacteriales archaeon QS_8_69_26]|nr:MAG: hypothetical protein BRD00_03225 [Halobacteriales archaeon QS_8_69_26]
MFDELALENCMHEDLYRYDLPEVPPDRLRDCLSDLGAVEQPIAGNPLFKMDEPGFVVTGNLDEATFQLRIKTTAEESGIRDRFVAHMEECLAPEAVADRKESATNGA